jgi:CheY-like chemotaxis protein
MAFDMTLQGWTALAVNDDTAMLDLMKIFMERHGVNLLTAKHGRAGLQIAQREKPDFIMTDITMPIMDGWELIRALKKDAATCDIPIVVLTHYSGDGSREEALALGCLDYIDVALTPRDLVGRLIGLLREVPALRHRFPGNGTA